MSTSGSEANGLPYPPLFELAGASMEPSLLRGWRVRVAPLQGVPRPGELVLFQTESGHLLHRVVHSSRFRDGSWVFHRGDGGGRIGSSPAASAVGRVVAIIDPPGHPLPTLDRIPPRRRRAFQAARSRARLYAACRRLAQALHLDGTPAARLGGHWLRRLLS